MQLTVVPFVISDHFEGTVDVLARMRQIDNTYPPEQDAGDDRASLGSWLMDDNPKHRWAAVADGKVIGHVTAGTPHRYLTDFMVSKSWTPNEIDELSEVGKFFVDPTQQGSGIGYALFKFVVSFLKDSGERPVLAVLAGSTAALRFYDRFGLSQVGDFEGIHGKNYVYVGAETKLGDEILVD